MIDQHSKLFVTLTDWDTGMYYPPWFLVIEKYSIFFATHYWILVEQLLRAMAEDTTRRIRRSGALFHFLRWTYQLSRDPVMCLQVR